MIREKGKREMTRHVLQGSDAAGMMAVAAAARKCTVPFAAGTVPVEVAVARSRAPRAAGTVPAAVVAARSSAPAAAGTAPAAVAVAPARSGSSRRHCCFCRTLRRRWCRLYMQAEHCRRGRQRRHVLDRMSGATAAGSLAGRGRYASGEVAQVRRARGGGSGILDPFATRQTDACASTRCRFRIVREGQPHVSVAGYQKDGEGSVGIRHNYIRRGGLGYDGKSLPLPPTAGARPSTDLTTNRLLRRRFLYPQLPSAEALRYNPHARDRLRATAAAAAAVRCVAVSPAFSTVSSSPFPAIWVTAVSPIRPVGSNESVSRPGPLVFPPSPSQFPV